MHAKHLHQKVILIIKKIEIISIYWFLLNYIDCLQKRLMFPLSVLEMLVLLNSIAITCAAIYFAWPRVTYRYHMWVRSWIHNSHLMQAFGNLLITFHDSLVGRFALELQRQLRQLTTRMSGLFHQIAQILMMLYEIRASLERVENLLAAAPQPVAPASQPNAPAQQPNAPAPQPDTPAQQPNAPAPQPDTPAQQPNAPAQQPNA